MDYKYNVKIAKEWLTLFTTECNNSALFYLSKLTLEKLAFQEETIAVHPFHFQYSTF